MRDCCVDALAGCVWERKGVGEMGNQIIKNPNNKLRFPMFAKDEKCFQCQYGSHSPFSNLLCTVCTHFEVIHKIDNFTPKDEGEKNE